MNEIVVTSCEIFAENKEKAKLKAGTIENGFTYGHICGELTAYNKIYDTIHDRIADLTNDDSSAAALVTGELCSLLDKVWTQIDALDTAQTEYFDRVANDPANLTNIDLTDFTPIDIEAEEKWLEEEDKKLTEIQKQLNQ